MQWHMTNVNETCNGCFNMHGSLRCINMYGSDNNIRCRGRDRVNTCMNQWSMVKFIAAGRNREIVDWEELKFTRTTYMALGKKNYRVDVCVQGCKRPYRVKEAKRCCGCNSKGWKLQTMSCNKSFQLCRITGIKEQVMTRVSERECFHSFFMNRNP